MLLTESYSNILCKRVIVGYLSSRSSRKKLHYYSIGHFTKEGKESPVLWYWDGRLHTKNVNFEGQLKGRVPTHGYAWPNKPNWGQIFYGRYEPWSGKLSVTKPERLAHRDLPDRLLQDLHRHFEKITHIEEFS